MADAPAPTLQPRTRLVVAMLLAFGAASVHDPALLPALGALVLGVAALVRPPRSFVRRLAAPLVLSLAILGLLPLMGTDTGAALLIAARVLAIATIVLVLASGLSATQMTAALRGLHVPVLICDLALLTLRYLHDMRQELARARLARDLRGGPAGWRALPDFGALLAVLMIRALKRSERVWAAMRMRGYQGGVIAPPLPLDWRDHGAIAGAGLVALALVGARL